MTWTTWNVKFENEDKSAGSADLTGPYMDELAARNGFKTIHPTKKIMAIAAGHGKDEPPANADAATPKK